MKNEILVEWLEPKDIGNRNRVIVKHIVDETKSITVNIVVIFNSKRYKVNYIDLLDWTAPKKRHMKAQNPR